MRSGQAWSTAKGFATATGLRVLKALVGRWQKATTLQKAGVWATLLTSAATSVAATAIANKRFLRIEVEGVSMVPVLGPGDKVLVLRTKRVTVGDIVVLADPESPTSGHLVVKRVTAVEWNSVRVEGDNEGASRDSRHFGPVPMTAVTGRVLWCYWSPYRSAGGSPYGSTYSSSHPPATLSRPASLSTTLRQSAGHSSVRRAGGETGVSDQ